MATALNAGYRHAELWTDAAVLADWHAVSERCSRFPLAYAVHFPNRAPRSEQLLTDAARFYRAVDASVMVIHQPLFDQFGAALLGIDPGMRLAVENHVLSPAEFDDWARCNSGLTLDVEHLWHFTLRDAPLGSLLERLGLFLDRHRQQLWHVHLPGYLPGSGEHRPMSTSREMVQAVFSLLADYHYEGMIVSEVAGAFQTAEALAADMALYLEWSRQR